MLRSAEFRRVYDNGVRLSGPLFAAFILARPESGATGSNEVPGPRLGLTVPRAMGGAVERNRTKRRLREIFRLRRTEIGAFDIVINPRRPILSATAEELRRAFDKLVDRVKA